MAFDRTAFDPGAFDGVALDDEALAGEASHRPVRRWAFLRLLRIVAILATVAVPAVAVTTVDAHAHEHPTKLAGADERDDMTLFRVGVNAARVEQARRAAPPVALDVPVPTAADRQRASRDLIRKVLTRPVYVRPVPGPVTQWYGSHPGIDIAPGYGTPVGAAHAGVVTFVGWQDGYGMHVEVTQVDGFVTTYSHMSGFTTNVGQLVKAGQQLGMVGSTGWSTGPHLHFEVHLPNGQRTDPAVWLREHGVAV
ncbi:MAG: Peptidase [Mycobacterium sp.]|nr:Peptidase [Mycobacterium sp.]